MSSTAVPKVVPAQLSFLAIYNPALGKSDETFHNQIVFFYSKATKARSKIDGKDAQAARALREQENEKLRQVGLAQGMVGFARSFSAGEAVDSVETHKSRIILHELEEGWWILASIDLTQLPAASSTTFQTDGTSQTQAAPEYSSREVSPPALLLQQLKRAYSIFLLHHGSTLDRLFSKFHRVKFCSILDKFWTHFASNWDVLLHGSPSVEIFGGMKLAAGGELGMGVGEEEWGSGEREVLEDYARRTEGLVDVMVSRFGEPSPLQHKNASTNAKALADAAPLEPWIGSGNSVNAVDGVVFSGTGAISRPSLRDISHWVEFIYCYGEQAYGVRENPTTDRRKRRRRNPRTAGRDHSAAPAKDTHDSIRTDSRAFGAKSNTSPGIPPPIVTAVEASLDKASAAAESTSNAEPNKPDPITASLGDAETWMKYLTLGYGTAWGGKRAQEPESDQPPDADVEAQPELSMRYVEPEPDVDKEEEKLKTQVRQENAGYFIIGLKGDMADETTENENDEDDWNHRIPLRTLHVEVCSKTEPETTGSKEDESSAYERTMSSKASSISRLSRLRPVVYVHRPFIYTFLFTHRTESLTLATFYRNLHTYFSPLHRPLSNSTSPDKVAARISAASNPHTTISSASGSRPNMQPIYDLVYDPRTLTVHSSLPNIPEPGTLVAEGLGDSGGLSSWSRVEALNVHSQVLTTVTSTRRTVTEIERTCKTSRGWWVVWMRLPPSEHAIPQQEDRESARSVEFNSADLREAFLVRRANDSVSSTPKSSGSRLGSGMWRLGVPSTGEKMGGAAAGWGPKGLGEGIGIDARRYVDGLLSLNR